MTKHNTKVRIAPSPTGNLHLGTARTALFNYLYARNQGGEFVIRIEDTDAERSEKRYEDNILQGLEWLGMDWDGEIVRQSKRGNVYRSYLEKMLNSNSAFYCWHEKHELQQEQQQQTEQKQAPRHICKYKNATPTKEQVNSSIIRFNNTHTAQLNFRDYIKGDISFDPALLGDFSIAKNINAALYNFAVVIDDYDMEITDVIRGEDHISNTPKQMLLQKTLQLPTPQYAHLPLILGTDKSKLSKRHGATAVEEYKQQGFLPQAMFNFLCLLGWHPDSDKEIYTQQELIHTFSLAQVQVSPAIFDIEKLQWMNKQYIQNLNLQEFEVVIQEYSKQGREDMPQHYNKEKIFVLAQQRVKTLTEIDAAISEVVDCEPYNSELLCYKEQPVDKVGIILQNICDIIQGISTNEWDKTSLSECMLTVVDKYDQKGQVLHPLRVAMSGKKSSPPPYDIMEAVGKQESIKRIERAVALCRQQSIS